MHQKKNKKRYKKIRKISHSTSYLNCSHDHGYQWSRPSQSVAALKTLETFLWLKLCQSPLYISTLFQQFLHLSRLLSDSLVHTL